MLRSVLGRYQTGHSGAHNGRLVWQQNTVPIACYLWALECPILFLMTGFFPGSSVVLPPACSIFSSALLLNRCAETESFFFNSPLPKTLKISKWGGMSFFARTVSGVTESPLLNAFCRSSTLTTATTGAQRLLKPRFGIRRTIGMAPPWKDT